jgi:outer membrane protein
VTSGIAQVRALEQALTSTQSQLDSTILGRDVGVRTSVDVLNAQQQVYQTRRDLQQARYNYLVNTLRLKSAAGQLSEADLEDVNRTLSR